MPDAPNRDWRGQLRDLARDLGSHARRVARAVDRSVEREPYHVVGYRGYASRWRALILGRVLQDDGMAPADSSHGSWRNLLSMVRRLESDPMPFARVRVRIGDSDSEMVADDEGFFREWAKLPTSLAENQWHDVQLELVSGSAPSPVRAASQVLVPSPHAAFGVISDMDDTVLQSDVTTFLSAVRLMLLENSRTRLPFPGVAAFYRALRDGVGAGPANPIFYVSSSPWNLYDVITDFLEAQRIPTGPLLLRDWDLSSALSGHADHKALLIHDILDTYPWMRFILIGDSGQEDPEIYSAIVRDYPGRVLAVYIRDVSHDRTRSAAIAALAEQVAAAQSLLVHADDTLTAARHAAEHGWIDSRRLAEIGDEKRADEGTPGSSSH